jgi:hypothetical protein
MLYFTVGTCHPELVEGWFDKLTMTVIYLKSKSNRKV